MGKLYTKEQHTMTTVSYVRFGIAPDTLRNWFAWADKSKAVRKFLSDWYAGKIEKF